MKKNIVFLMLLIALTSCTQNTNKRRQQSSNNDNHSIKSISQTNNVSFSTLTNMVPNEIFDSLLNALKSNDTAYINERFSDSFVFIFNDISFNKSQFFKYLKANKGVLIPKYTKLTVDTFVRSSFFHRDSVPYLISLRNFRREIKSSSNGFNVLPYGEKYFFKVEKNKWECQKIQITKELHFSDEEL